MLLKRLLRNSFNFRACEDFTYGLRISNFAKLDSNWSKKLVAVINEPAECLNRLKGRMFWHT